MSLQNHKFANLTVLIVLAVGLASAGMLQSFGIISGTADVDPAVEIKEKDLDNSEVTVVRNVDREITEDDEVELTESDSCEENTNIVEDSTYIEIESEDDDDDEKNVDVDSEHDGAVYVCIQEVNVDDEQE